MSREIPLTPDSHNAHENPLLLPIRGPRLARTLVLFLDLQAQVAVSAEAGAVVAVARLTKVIVVDCC